MQHGAPLTVSAEEKLQLLVDASTILLGTLDMEELLGKILELAGKLNDAEACAIWRYDPESKVWRIASSSGLSPANVGGVLLDTAARLSDHPLAIEDVRSDPLLSSRHEFYVAEGIHSLVVMPLRAGTELSGTLVFYYRRPHRFTETELRVVSALGNLASGAIETASLYREKDRARHAAEVARMRANLLAEASAVLGSSSDYESTLAAVAQLAVPQAADWCAVHLVLAEGGLRLVAVAHKDSAQVVRTRYVFERHAADADPPCGPRHVARTGIAELVPLISEAGENAGWLGNLACESYLCVPMMVRDRVLGLITFLGAPGRLPFDHEDLALAEDLAHRAAVAVDHAQLSARAEREPAALEAALSALRENEDRLLLALRSGRMGIWDWDLVTKEVNWTDELLALIGFNPVGFNGDFASFLALIHPDDLPTVQSSLDRALETKSYLDCEFRVLYAENTIRWLSVKGQVFCNDEGKAVRMTGLGMDITERRQLEDKLRSSQKLESIGLLAGGIAHDFNNLLTGIMGNAGLARDLVGPSHDAAMLLDNVLSASERAADLTRQLLAYSGKGRFVIEPVNLSSLVREIVQLLTATVPKMVRLELDLDSSVPPIEGDASQIQQIIMNLVINGAEAIGDRGGTVLVRTALVDRASLEWPLAEEPSGNRLVVLEVRDDGCGMDAETKARIFDPFYTTKFTGRGLGLAAVSGIVRGHHGAIHVESAPGQGSIFRVLFPGSEAVRQQPRREAAGQLSGTGRILVIDDEESVRSAAEAALRRYGYDVVTAVDGAEGVEILRGRPADFAAVLLDLTMPVMGGEVALQQIKEIQPGLPVIASSGYSEMEANRRFAAGELAAFLQKPYTSATLAQRVKSVLSKPVGRAIVPAAGF